LIEYSLDFYLDRLTFVFASGVRSPPAGSYDREPDHSFDLGGADLGRISLGTTGWVTDQYFNMAAMRLDDRENHVLLETKTEDAVRLSWPRGRAKCSFGRQFTLKQIELSQVESIVSAKINTVDFSTVDIKVLIYEKSVDRT